MFKIFEKSIIRWCMMWSSLVLLSVGISYYSQEQNKFQQEVAESNSQWTHVKQILANEGRAISAKTQDQIARTIISLSQLNEIDPLLVLAIIKIESAFRPQVVSHAGAIGLMQVKTIVVRELDGQLPIISGPAEQLLRNPLSNIHIGIGYLGYLRNRFGANNWYHVLAAYNMGPTRVGRILERRQNPSKRYYSKVMRAYRRYVNGAAFASVPSKNSYL